ncbi:MAG: hypothetical protein IJC19_06270 [Clostridia bacterium]|nr:hypothetical protein [Clostridia bacterium]
MTDISPRFSLLFADPKGTKEEFYPPETMDFIGDLPCEDSALMREILSRKTTRKDIAFRKEILEDFLQSPTLLTKTEGVLQRWEGLYETARRESLPTADMPWEQGLEVLKDNALSLMEHLRFLRRAHDEMADQTPDSEGMFAFTEYLRRHGNSEGVKTLTEQIAAYPLLRAEQTKVVLHLGLDRYGMKQKALLTYLGTEDGKYLKKHPLRREDFSVNLPKENAPQLTAEAIGSLCRSFRTLTAGIRAAFVPLREGMVFYHFALSITEWARSKGYAWRYASPVAEHGPAGRGIRNPAEPADGLYRPPLTCTARPLEAYRGEWGTETLKILARTQIFSTAGLPVVAEDLVFCPEERILVYDSADKTVETEIEALAALYRKTRRGDILLLNQPLITVGNSPATEIIGNLLRAFHKKGAAVRLATDLSVD